ncbi:MAG: SCP2 sterol-binding domain-containing protein [Anaerolineales bacterium]|jgi:putative sterol carrier protein|nr:SCP2 sterol-binding domain-containing protein [Anaerolineales bacterium]
MAAIFPSAEWLAAFKEKLNNDQRYAQVAKNWEGDMYFVIEPEGNLAAQIIMYLDLWHGECRAVEMVAEAGKYNPAFVLKAGYNNFAGVLTGKLDPMQAMLTRKLDVKGNMAVMMRNVPTVLDFVRCAKEITTEIL